MKWLIVYEDERHSNKDEMACMGCIVFVLCTATLFVGCLGFIFGPGLEGKHFLKHGSRFLIGICLSVAFVHYLDSHTPWASRLFIRIFWVVVIAVLIVAAYALLMIAFG